MQKNKNRQGLALGAIAALVAGAFVGAPAQATTAQNLTIVPTAGTSLVGLVTDDFELQVTLDPAYASTVGYSKLSYLVENSSTLLDVDVDTYAGGSALVGATSSRTVALEDEGYFSSSNAVNTANTIKLKASSTSAITSVSAEVSVTVTAFIDNVVSNGTLDSGEWRVATTVVLKPHSALAGAVTLTSPQAGDVWATASFAVSTTAVNLDQLDNSFSVVFTSTNDGAAFGDSQSSIVVSHAKAGTMSASQQIASASSSPVASISAILLYTSSGTAIAGDQLAISTLGVGAPSIDGLTFSPVAGTNIDSTGAGTADARVNSAFAVTAKPYTGSGTAVAVASNLNWSTSTELSTTKYLVVNGVTHTSSATIATTASPLVLAAGSNTVTIEAVGFSGNEVITLQLNAQNKTTAVYQITLKTPSFVLANNGDFDNYFAALGESVALSFTVEDQFGLDSARTNQRVAASVVLGGSTSETVSAAVVAGQVALTVAPVPATRTGSATVTLTLQTQNADTGLYENGDTHTVTINVSAAANAFNSRTASVSASISRQIATSAYSWSGDVSVDVVNSYSMVTATAPAGIYVKNGTDSASGTLTAQADGNGAVTFAFAGTVAGTYTVTFTNGSASTTSEVIIGAADNDEGTVVTISGADSSMQGKTVTYTGLVTDEFGNPIDTTRGDAGATVTVTFTGPGLYSGTLPTETDEDGEFVFSLQTAANDEGTIAVTATYNNEGTSTAAADKVSATKLTSVAAPVVATAQTVSVAAAASVEAGKNADVTITVTDSDGNAHAYKSVVVYSTGAGYLSAQTVTTDGEGKAVVKLITSANESGTATITASVGGKSGTATVTVAAPAVEVVPEVEAFIGSFNGRWAVRVENAKLGDRVVIKVGGNYYGFDYKSETGSQLFSRKSKVGAEVAITVWVNGGLVNTETIAIK